MPLTDVLERLYARRRFGIRPGVDRVVELLKRLGNPEKQFRTIHVVGTNGKGSTSAFLSSVLLHAGHSVAQFSSPHLVRFTERFRINGLEYSAEKLASRLEIVLRAAPAEATFFEITTALAAYIFCEEQIEFAVMEAGMGGCSDATAAFSGELTLITPISLDHTDYLGKSVENIASEKAGIIKNGTFVISADQLTEVTPIIEEQCRARKCDLKIFGKDFSTNWNTAGTLDYQGISHNFTDISPGIPGSYQSVNAAVAMAAFEVLGTSGMNVSPAAVKEGIEKTYWPGRMELIPGKPPLLLDGAHNPAGAMALARALAGYRYSRLFMVTGVCNDKEFEHIYAPLITLIDTVYTVTPSIERALDDKSLAFFFQNNGIQVYPSGSVVAGITNARSKADSDDLILVCGSLFVVGEVKAWLGQVNFTGIRG